MKNLLKFTLATLFVFGFVAVSLAQFTLSGEFRPRTEYRHGYKTLATPDMDAAFFTDQRTRLNLDFKSEGYNFYVSLQDVRVWGSQKQLVTDDGALTTLHQAWTQIFFNDKISLKAGRQEIAYDDHRIFGSVGWAQQARSHDAFVFKYMENDTKVDVGLAFNFNAGAAANYEAIQYVWFNQGFDNFKTSVLLLNNGKDAGDDGTKYSQTIGTRSGYKAGKFSAFVNLYYQGGKLPDDTKINANLIGLDFDFKATDNATIGVGYERQSGNDMVDTNDENNAFTPFYGTNHKFNGHMDYFYVGNHGGSVGLQDIFVKLGLNMKKTTLGAHLHYFMTAADLNDGKGNAMDAGLGTEIDLSLGFPLAKGVSCKFGYSHMIGSETMETLKGGSTDETSNWGWLMIVAKPQLFTTAKN